MRGILSRAYANGGDVNTEDDYGDAVDNGSWDDPYAQTLNVMQARSDSVPVTGAIAPRVNPADAQRLSDIDRASQRIEEMQQAREASRNGGVNLPLLAAAGAMLAPTKTGGFGESLSNSIGAAVPLAQKDRALEEQTQMRMAQQEWNAAVKKAELADRSEGRTLQDRRDTNTERHQRAMERAQEARNALTQKGVEQGRVTPVSGFGPDPKDPTKEVEGTWLMSNIPGGKNVFNADIRLTKRPGADEKNPLGNTQQANAAQVMNNIGPKILAGTATEQEIRTFRSGADMWSRETTNPTTGAVTPGLPFTAEQQLVIDRLNTNKPAVAPSQDAAPSAGQVQTTATGSTRTVTPPQQSAQALEAYRKTYEGVDKVKRAFEQYRQAIKDTGGAGFNTFVNNPQDPAAQRLLASYALVEMAMRDPSLFNTGVLQPAEMTMIRTKLLAPDSFRGAIATPESIEANMKEFEKYVDGHANTVRKLANIPDPADKEDGRQTNPRNRTSEMIPTFTEKQYNDADKGTKYRKDGDPPGKWRVKE